MRHLDNHCNRIFNLPCSANELRTRSLRIFHSRPRTSARGGRAAGEYSWLEPPEVRHPASATPRSPPTLRPANPIVAGQSSKIRGRIEMLGREFLQNDATPELLWQVLSAKRWSLLKALCGAARTPDSR